MRVELNPGRGGSLRKNPPAKIMTMTRTATIPRGWRLALIGSSRVHLELISTLLGRKLRRRLQADPTARALTPLSRLRPVMSPRALLPCPRRVAMLGPRRRGTDSRSRCGLRERRGRPQERQSRRPPGRNCRAKASARPRGAWTLTWGGSRPTGRGGGRRAVLPVG